MSAIIYLKVIDLVEIYLLLVTKSVQLDLNQEKSAELSDAVVFHMMKLLLHVKHILKELNLARPVNNSKVRIQTHSFQLYILFSLSSKRYLSYDLVIVFTANFN